MMKYQDNQDDSHLPDFSFDGSNSTHGFPSWTPYLTSPFDYNCENNNTSPTHLQFVNHPLILPYQVPVYQPLHDSIDSSSEFATLANLSFDQATITDPFEPTNGTVEPSFMPEPGPEPGDSWFQPGLTPDEASFLGSPNSPDKNYKEDICLCVQCNECFESHSDLNHHAMTTGHGAYQCLSCDKKFSRIDCLQRHNRLHHTIELPRKYSCQYCEKWKAPRGFGRKDHLDQHLRIYHHLPTDQKYNMNSWLPDESGFHRYCLQQGCSLFRTEEEGWNMGSDSLFPSRAAFTKHTREAHNTSIYPCTQLGCKKVNGKGFFRKRSLVQHMKKEYNIDISEQAEPNANSETHNLDDNWFMNGVL